VLQEHFFDQPTSFLPIKQSVSNLKKETPNLPFSLKDLVPEATFLEQNSIKKPKKEIENPNKDKTIIILNFILNEVLPIKDREKQKELLVYFFKSILSETQQLPVTHLAYEITKNNNNQLALHDDVYQLRPDLLKVCQEAVESLVINQAEKARYSIEKEQIENLILTLENLFSLAPHATLDLIANQDTKELINTNKTKQKLENSGWKTLSPSQAFSFIQPEVKEKMKIEKISGEITVGPKYLYIMPQSAVHEGNMSIIVIAQPIFIPALNRFILLHDQNMAEKTWVDHEKLLKKFKKQIPDNFSNLKFAQKEKVVMKQLIELPKEFQTLTAKATFFEIFPEKKLLKKLRQKITRQRIKEMEPSLKEYAELVIDVTKSEINKDPGLRQSTVEKLSNFMKRVVLSGILDVKKISTKEKEKLFKHFQKFGNLKEKEFALSLKSIGFSSAVKAFDTSLLECVALSPMSSVKQLANIQTNGLNPSMLTRKDLGKFVGKKRSKDWKIGSCLKCGGLNTWVGECDWCLNCEMNYPKIKTPQTSFKPKKNPLLSNSRRKTEKPAIFSENLGSFIANLI
jgi:hypothetical protein